MEIVFDLRRQARFSFFLLPFSLLESEVKTLCEHYYCLRRISHLASSPSERTKSENTFAFGVLVLYYLLSTSMLPLCIALKLLSRDIFPVQSFSVCVCQYNRRGCVRMPPWALIPCSVCMHFTARECRPRLFLGILQGHFAKLRDLPSLWSCYDFVFPTVPSHIT